MQPYPRAPDLVWPGHLHGTGCLSARAVGTGFPTVGLRLWLGPGCGWSWVLFSPARCGWGLGWVCLGSVCGVVPLLPAVCGVRGWALVWACFRDLCGFLRVSLAPRRFRFRCAVWAPGSRLCPALLGWVVGLCFLRFFVFFFFRLWGVLVPGLVVPPPSPFFRGLLAFFFFFFLLVSVSLFSAGSLSLARCCRSWLGGPPVPVWGSCLRCPLGGGFGPLLCCWWAVWWLWAVFARPTPPPPLFFFFFCSGGGGPAGLFLPLPSLGWRLLCGWCVVWLVPRHSWLRFLCATPHHSWLGFAAGGCGRSPPLLAGVCRRRWCLVCGGGVLVGLWLVCGVVGPSPLLAEVPVCYSPPLLAGFRFRWCWAGPAIPGWGPLAALLCGVWCVAVVCWWGCGWCVVWLVPRHSWRRFLCATPRHSWLGFAAGGGGRSPPLLAGVRLRRWCVVCGVWCVAVVCGWGCGWCVVWLVPRHSWRRFLCATPRHSWLGFASGGGGRSPPLLAGVRWRRCCLVCGVWRWCVGGVVAGVWCGWSLATPGGGSCVLLPATPGWVSLPVVVGGPRHSWLGSACGGGVWCVVCGVWRWCVGGVVAGVWCGWSLATPGGGSCVLLPATPGWVSLPVVVGGPRHSWLGSVGGVAVWCVVCGAGVLVGLWLACGVVGPSPLLAEVPVCYSPPLLAGFRCRWWWAVPATPGWGPLAAVVCGVWCVVCGGGVLVGLWLVCGVVGPSSLLAEVPVCYSPPLLAGFRCRWWWAVPATPGWGPLAAVVCGLWCVVCGGGVLVGLWLVCGVVGPSPLLAEVPVCYSPPLRAGFRCRWCWAVPATPGWGPLAAVVCGVLLGSLATPGGGSCVLLPATPGWVSLPLVVGGPRHSWLGSFGGGGVRVLLGRVGRAGLPGALWCASPFPLAALSFCFAWPPPGWGCPPLLRCCCRSSLAGVCGVWVGCCLAPVRVPWFFACCARSPGLWHPAAVAAWHLSVCPGCGRRRASLVCLVAPRGAPRLVRSGRSRCSSRLSRRRGAFPHPGSLRPRLYWAAARGTRRPAENRAHCACGWPPPRQGRWALRVVPVRGPAMGLSLAGPSGVGLGLRALRWLACVDPVTDASGFPYRPSFDGGLGRCTGAVSCGRRHLPLRVGGRHARVPCVFACACSSWSGRAGRPPGRVLVRLTFSFGRFVFLLCLAPSGLGLPLSFSLLLPFPVGCYSRPPAAWLAPRLCPPLGRWLLFGGCSPAPPIVMHICMHTHSARPNLTHSLSVHCAAPSTSLFFLLIPLLLVLKSWSGFMFIEITVYLNGAGTGSKATAIGIN